MHPPRFFHPPLFFLVSGFFLCRPISEWTRPRILNALRVRSLALLGGTIVVSTIYFSILTKNDPFLWLPYAGFDLYWFTISLPDVYSISARRRPGEAHPPMGAMDHRRRSRRRESRLDCLPLRPLLEFLALLQ